ncbi:tryptophan dimethylallyltransferase family protein [Kitasatospora sp. NPDC049285]|uniref:tryptophan dimethylallyltransferase family protein n=1 Tax=Kitasatospora sp. NPDC049285 TaxID=3157096 RepID=UPI0034480709
MDQASRDAAVQHPAPSHPPIPAPGGGYLLSTPVPRPVGPRDAAPRRRSGGPAVGRTVGGHTVRQLLPLCAQAGLGAADSAAYARALTEALGPVADRPLDLAPGTPSFLSDDHTPVEFSLSFAVGAAPTLRVLLEPASGLGSLAESGRAGLLAVRALAQRWNISTGPLDAVEDLFFPDRPHGAFALWLALELLPGGVPRMKVYLNPAARGPEHQAATFREALHRLGRTSALDALPGHDRLVFFALDLGDWEQPRVKFYTSHPGLAPSAVGALSTMAGGPNPAELESFLRTAAGLPADRHTRLDRRPVLTCHAFTGAADGLPSGFTLYLPVRDYARHDGEVLDRTVVLLDRYGIDPTPLREALPAVTPRPLESGVGLIAHLALAHQQGHPPRVTTYLSSEAYRVRPPAA